MTYETIRYDLEGGIALVTLNRPKVMNSLTKTMRAELLAALERAETEARVVVLTGEGRAFCAGQDLADVPRDGSWNSAVSLREEYNPLILKMKALSLPVIAAVNGVAAGAGANLALAADVVIADEAAIFLQAFTRIGLIPDAGGSHSLPRLVGRARAMGHALFAEPVTGRQAADWGMIWEAVPTAEFAAHWRARAAQLAAGPTLAYGMVKQAIQASEGNDLAQQLDLEAELQGRASASGDAAEGVAAFLAKRPAVFTGR